jgi:lipopolysaccharide heptosyltransferase II
MPKISDPRNIVLIRTDRIGEVLLSTVAVDALRERYPGARVSFVTSAYSKPLLDGRKDISEVITFDTSGRGKVISRAVGLAAILRRRRFDTAVVFNPHKILHLACFLAGIRRRAGYDRKWGFLLDRTVPDERDRGVKHEIEYTMDLLRVLDVEKGPPAPHLHVSEGSEAELEDLLKMKGVKLEGRFIAVHPGSSNPAKIWPAERYAELIRRIRSELHLPVAVLGDKDERDLAGRIISDSGADVIDLAGALDLGQLTALLKRSALFVGNDTGPMHMAAALGVPVVAIFGRNIPGVSPARWRPWGAGHVVFHEDSLRSITVDAVFGAVKKKMSE